MAASGKRQRIIAREHEEIFRHLLDHLRHLGNISGSFLHADDVLDFGERRSVGGSMFTLVRGGTLYRMIGSEIAVSNGLEVVVQPFLRGLVVVGRDGKNSVRAQALDSRAISITWCVLYPPAPASTGTLPLASSMRDRHDAQMLFVRQRGAFARGAARHQEIDSRLDLPAHQTAAASLRRATNPSGTE